MAGRKRAWLPCRAQGCSYSGTKMELEDHWRNLHDPNVVLYLCPLPKCGAKVRERHHRESHWWRFHNLTRAQCRQLASLPVVAELKPNKHFKPPGSVIAPVQPTCLPAGALRYNQQGSLHQRVAAMLNPVQCVQPPEMPPPPPQALSCPSQPDPSPSVDCSFLTEFLEVEVCDSGSTRTWGEEAIATTASEVTSLPGPASTTTSTSTCVTSTAILPPDSASLDEELEAVEGELGRLTEKRRQLQLQSTLALLQRVVKAEQERDQAREQVRVLEERLRRAQQQETQGRGHTFADLERLPLTRGLLLFPCILRGQPSVTSVYGLSSADLAQLQLGNRDPMMSFEAI